jgi:serine/threonine protein phosphatase PrpC
VTDATLVACPSCGEPTAPGDRFCEACGRELGPGASAGAGVAGDEPGGAGGGAVTVADAGEAGEPGAAAGPAPALPAPAATCPACGNPAEWLDGYCGVCGARQPAPRDHLELSVPGMAAVTDKGRRHHRNEDAFAVGKGDGFVAAVVCDGVTTTVNSDEASQAAVDAALAVLLSSQDLDQAYDAARTAVLAVPFDPHPDLGPPSCTFLAAVVGSGEVRMASAGDCRSYWLAADGTVSRLTTDDSWADQALAAGHPAEEVWADPRAHSIVRWLGADADPGWRPTHTRFQAPSPGRLLLCSDGLWNYTLEESHLAVLVKEGGAEDLLALARRLVQFANDAGGADNITAVLVELPAPDAAPLPGWTSPPTVGGTPETP